MSNRVSPRPRYVSPAQLARAARSAGHEAADRVQRGDYETARKLFGELANSAREWADAKRSGKGRALAPWVDRRCRLVDALVEAVERAGAVSDEIAERVRRELSKTVLRKMPDYIVIEALSDAVDLLRTAPSAATVGLRRIARATGPGSTSEQRNGA
jgi:uncharacterized protein HemY